MAENNTRHPCYQRTPQRPRLQSIPEEEPDFVDSESGAAASESGEEAVDSSDSRASLERTSPVVSPADDDPEFQKFVRDLFPRERPPQLHISNRRAIYSPTNRDFKAGDTLLGPNMTETDTSDIPPLLLRPVSGVITQQKSEAIQLAREQQQAIHEKLKRNGLDPPPFDFLELIGKGSYGRVYKAISHKDGQIVALKVLDVDDVDYKMNAAEKDDSIQGFIHEISILKQLKESSVKNVNLIYDAFSIHSQLWIITEYCPGGSLRTLMRATGNKLDERYIIPVARELAEGLKSIHKSGIIHRDVKAANILICEDGRLQICDFGVAGVLQHELDKRSTIIGTPYWMAPEMLPSANSSRDISYGFEVDVWAYGCTLIEIASGAPPNARIPVGRALARQLQRNEPRLDNTKYPEGLCSLVAFTLKANPKERPVIAAILQHPYLAGSESAYPTESLKELVAKFHSWSQGGGTRFSLYQPGGAEAAQFPDQRASIYRDSWNFSTSDNPPLSMSRLSLATSSKLATMDEERVRRGEAAMAAIHDFSKPEYKYDPTAAPPPVSQRQEFSDLPLRADTELSTVREVEIEKPEASLDMGDFDPRYHEAVTQLADISTIKANKSRASSGYARASLASQQVAAEPESSEQSISYGPSDKRATLEWTFPSSSSPPPPPPVAAVAESTAVPELPDEGTIRPADMGNKRATMEWTFPSAEPEPEPPLTVRPPTIAEVPTPVASPPSPPTLAPAPSIPTPNSVTPSPSPPAAAQLPKERELMPPPVATPSRATAAPLSGQHSRQFPPIAPPSQESMEEDADPDITAEELERLIDDLSDAFGTTLELLEAMSDSDDD